MKYPHRVTPYPEDEVAYVDDSYIIFKKHGSITGTVNSPMDILDIAIDGMKREDTRELLDKKDWNKVIDFAIEDLKKAKHKDEPATQ